MPRMRTFFTISITVTCGLLLSACDEGGTIGAGGAGGASASSASSTSTGETASTSSVSASSSASSSSGGSGGTDPIANVGKVELLSGGYQFTEGPLWIAEEEALLISDVQGDTIFKIKPPATTGAVFRQPSDNANGEAFDLQKRLLTCEHAKRRVSRTEGNQVTPLADKFQNKKLNSPNDIIVRSDGTVYFTDPTFGLGNTPSDLGFQGVFRVDPTGAISLVEMGTGQPNGIALSPDEKTLYVADTTQAELRAFPVNADGSTGPGTKLIATSMSPDGMTVDNEGNLYLSTQAGIDVYKSDGSKRGTLTVPEQPSNCAFGGADGKTLYITARTSVYQVKLNVAGKP